MTATDAGKRNTHSFRAWDATWDDLAETGRAEQFSPATLLGDTADALAGYIRCARCGGTPVPVEFGNLAGRPLWEWITEAERAVRFQKCKDHQPVLVGAEEPAHARTDPPAVVPGTAVFMEPGSEPTVTAPVPQPADHTRKRGRGAKCSHVVSAGTRCKICEPRS